MDRGRDAMSTDHLRARMRAVFSARLPKNEKPVLRCYSVDFAAKNGVTDASGRNTAFPNENKAITPAHRFATNKEGQRENTLCSVCGAGGGLWHYGEALGWDSRDLFGLHTPPERPHSSYNRLSRYDATGLIWLLQGRDVIALTAKGAVIRTAIGAILTYYRHGRPAYGPIGDSVLD